MKRLNPYLRMAAYIIGGLGGSVIGSLFGFWAGMLLVALSSVDAPANGMIALLFCVIGALAGAALGIFVGHSLVLQLSVRHSPTQTVLPQPSDEDDVWPPAPGNGKPNPR